MTPQALTAALAAALPPEHRSPAIARSIRSRIRAVYDFVTIARQPSAGGAASERAAAAGARRSGRRGDTLATTTTSTYLSIENNLARYQKMVASEPAVKTATDYYAANIGKVNSISDLVNNYRLLSYALTAYGLGDQVNNKALVTKVLQGRHTSSKALANTLSNPNWAKFAKAFSYLSQQHERDLDTISSSGLDHGIGLCRAATRKPGRQAGRRRPARALFPARRADHQLVATTCSATRTCSRRSRPSSA